MKYLRWWIDGGINLGRTNPLNSIPSQVLLKGGFFYTYGKLDDPALKSL